MTRTSLRTRTAAVALAGSLAVLWAVPAAAADVSPMSTSQCASGRFCVWSGTAYTGSFASTSSGTVNTSFSRVGSVWNRSTRAAAVYSGPNGFGVSTCFGPGAQISSTSVSVASIRVLSTPGC